MSQAVLHLSDVYVSKGFDNKPQVTFKANEGSEYGVVRFKTSHKKVAKKGEKADYDNYTIEWRGVKSDSKMIELLNQPGVKVSLFGEITQEEFNGNKFIRVSCDGRNSVSIASYGEAKDGAPASSGSAPVAGNDEL